MNAPVSHSLKPDIHMPLYCVFSDLQYRVSGAQLATQQAQSNIMIFNCNFNNMCFLNVEAWASVLRQPPGCCFKHIHSGNRWDGVQIIVIMGTQWGRVVERVSCEAENHGSLTLENWKYSLYTHCTRTKRNYSDVKALDFPFSFL